MNEQTQNLKATLQKSYYNKAKVIFEGDILKLKSYDTIVLEYNTKTQKLKKLWQGYSRTTMNHINDFLKQFTTLDTMNKKQWLKNEPNEQKQLYKIEYSNGFFTTQSDAIFDDYDEAYNVASELFENRTNIYFDIVEV